VWHGGQTWRCAYVGGGDRAVYCMRAGVAGLGRRERVGGGGGEEVLSRDEA